MKKASQAIDTVIKYFLVILIAVISVLGLYQVIMRFVFNNSSSWSEEAIRFLFVWASCVGGAIGIKEHIHIGIDVVVNLLPAKWKNYVGIAVLLLLCLFGAVMIKYGFALTLKTAIQKSPALQLPMCYVYAAIPTLGVLCIYYSICEMIRDIRANRAKKEG